LPHPCLSHIAKLKEINIHIDEARIIQQERGISQEEQDFNIVNHGVNFPSAISEAIITISTLSKKGRVDTKDIILKVDSGASVSLAHPEFLTNVGNCITQGMAPVRLSGIGGKTEAIDKVGTLTIIKSTGERIKLKCYAFNDEVGDSLRLCLVSNWAIDHHRIDQHYHSYTSLRIGPQRVRFTKQKPLKAVRLQNKKNHRIAQGMIENCKI
jgi:hypothetical protein